MDPKDRPDKEDNDFYDPFWPDDLDDDNEEEED